jgi:anti-sigma factor (TIGR02949 family)
MTCLEFRAGLHPYVDGELPVSQAADADAHAADCPVCADLLRREQEFRRLLRRHPREAAPPGLRAAIVARVRRRRRATRALRILAPALGVAAAAVILVAFLQARGEQAALLGDLVDKHIAYAQIDRPAELASSDPGAVREWFQQRANLAVTVPDYSPAGIRLIGARLAEARERSAAYLLYEKGRTLLSVFMVPVSPPDAAPRGERVAYHGHEYVTTERKGYRTVSWREGRMLFGLVSMLDYPALLECADRLRVDDARERRL